VSDRLTRRSDGSDVVVHEFVDQGVFVSVYTCQVGERWLGLEHVVRVFHAVRVPKQGAEADCVARAAAIDLALIVVCADGVGRSFEAVSYGGIQGIVVTYTLDLRRQFV